jgi:hypothetical protein
MKNLIALVLIALVLVPGVVVAKEGEEQPPVSFSTTLAQFISYSDDVTALTAWYETLSGTEQAAYTEQFNAAHAKLATMEEGLVKGVTDQLDCGCMDSNLYLTFDTIKGMDPIKARKIFASATDKISARLNMDYLQSPSNPDLARRARDMQAVRAYIGHN